MANMSYCRFQNTSLDFRDCLGAVEEMDAESYADLSEDERYALQRLLEMALDLTDYANVLEQFEKDRKNDEIAA